MKTKENVYFRRDPDLPGLEARRVVESRHRFPDHFHDGLYGIGLMESGASYCMGPGRDDLVVAAGEMSLLNPGQVHSGVPVDDLQVTYTMFYVDSDTMASLARDFSPCHGCLPEFSATVVRDPRLFGLFRQMFCSLASDGDLLVKETLIVEAFGRLLSSHGSQVRPHASLKQQRHCVDRARALLSGDLDQKLTLDRVARSVGLSRYHFLRVFKQETGLSPHLFRTMKRVETAREFLLQGMAPAQVALETGFADQSHFTNTFRQYYGATPMQYLACR